jgi:nucleotide-binding universal stress UspA family protein
MPNPKILVPIDFTRLSDKVIEQAAILGTSSDADLVLLHCTDRSDDLDSVRVKIAEKAKKASVKYNVTCDSKVVGGSIFKMIPVEAEENDYQLMVIGTHGVRGLKQKLLGADILKLITKVPVPTLVVQSTSPFRRSFDKIILPVATHLAYENILQAVISIGKLFKSEVHIYSIERQGFKAPEQLKKNLQRTISLFDENGIRYIRVNEKQTVVSIGFAFQTLQYAQKIGADMIAIMSVSSEEYHYFAKQDKENLLTNEGGVPVLCACNEAKESTVGFKTNAPS